MSALLLPAAANAQNPNLYGGMRWRLVGPFRGGRSLAVAGIRGNPNLYYFGAVAGGVWRSTDAGRVWRPIFDAAHSPSIGAIAVAPSNPDVIYVGTGEADMRSDITYGNGMYKSTDGGKTWTHIGLADTRHIGRILVDPADPNLLYAAALGHAYGPNPERGVFRSRDGGATWQKILYRDENTGAIDLAFDPRDSRVIYAAMWQTRRPPWSVYPPSNGPGSGLFKSTDGGDHWQQLTDGLPVGVLGRIGIAVAPSQPDRVYAIVDARPGGLFRSDDAGAHWRKISADSRIWGRGWYFGETRVAPDNPDVVYVSNTSLYRSTDGGAHFMALKGAPGGDDYHGLWIAPDDSRRMILGSDQGVEISVDAGTTWTSWYNQPTAQFYHVAADNQFPYWIYGAQQDSGALSVDSRSNYGEITARDWHATAGGESGSIAPDPLHNGIVYGGTVERYNTASAASENVSPLIGHPGQYRTAWTLPLVFSPADHRSLYFGTQVLFKTSDGGRTWQIISPDLTRPDPGVPSNLDPSTAADRLGGPRRGVIYSISPSPLAPGQIWIGTDDGYVQLTRNGGKTWSNITPPELTAWSKISGIEASHRNVNSAYISVDRHRLDDFHPHLYRTRDGGRTWMPITAGIPDGSYVNGIREDSARAGLLFASTETGVYVSFDDGDRWSPLALNMPTVPVRDVAIHGDDLIAATHGRAFWVLDDITPLRQIAAFIQPAANGATGAAGAVAGRPGDSAILYRPAVALRMTSGGEGGTPFPPEVPAGQNPPNGAILDYYLPSQAHSIAIAIYDSHGKLVQRATAPPPNPARGSTGEAAAGATSNATSETAPAQPRLTVPDYWLRPPQPLPLTAGMHRVVWDLRYARPTEGRAAPNITEVATAPDPTFPQGGTLALPGAYRVVLTVDGSRFSQPLQIELDPRVHRTAAGLQAQFQASREAAAAIAGADKLRGAMTSVRAQIARIGRRDPQLADPADTVNASLTSLLLTRGAALPNFGSPITMGAGSVSGVSMLLRQVSGSLDREDADPTPALLAALRHARALLAADTADWRTLKSGALEQLNRRLETQHLPPIAVK